MPSLNEKLTDQQLADLLGLEDSADLLSTAKADGDLESTLTTLYVQTCAGAWVCTNSPGSLWEFQQDAQWE